jgi:cell wall-associated NlpC family hydrolase
MQGDILFYAHTDIPAKIISWWTKSRFNHVGIDMGDHTMVQATSIGVVQVNLEAPSARWSYKTGTTDYDQKDLDGAIKWLHSMLGRQYSYYDVTSGSGVLQKLFYIAHPGSYDCSALVVEFLNRAGGVDLGDIGSDPHLATPGSLAKQLHVQ